jgi:hypothetical protein
MDLIRSETERNKIQLALNFLQVEKGGTTMSNPNPFWDPFGAFSNDNSSSKRESASKLEGQKAQQSSHRADSEQISREVSLPRKEIQEPVPVSIAVPQTAPKAIDPDPLRTKIRELRKVLRKFEKEAKRDTRLSKPGNLQK